MQNHIRKIRERRSLTLEKVAEALGCTKAQISKLERGHIRLNDEWLDALSRVFSCSVHDLIDDDTPAERPVGEGVAKQRNYYTAKMLGYIDSNQVGLVEYVSDDLSYSINFSLPRELRGMASVQMSFYAFTVKGDAFPGFPDGSQFIFASIDDPIKPFLKDGAVILCSLKNQKGTEQGEVLRVLEYDELGMPKAVFKLRKSKHSVVTLASDFLLGEISASKRLSIIAKAEADQGYKKLPKQKISTVNSSLNINGILIKAIVDRI